MYNYKTGCEKSLAVARESNILLINENRTLPLDKEKPIAYFGRNGKHYLFVGTGSGITKPFYQKNIVDALKELGAKPDKETENFYDAFEQEHPYVSEPAWAPPTAQLEAVPDEALVEAAAKRCEVAIMQLNRVSGEGRDIESGRGEFRLSTEELKTLKLLRTHFSKLIVICNISFLMDFSEIVSIKPDALLIAWGAGIEGATSVAETLLGLVNPSGHLPDTIAKKLEDYPVHEVYAADNAYSEDIFVGYRHFESKAPKRVLFPFGFGLSYTDFALESGEFTHNSVKVKVTNMGDFAGKCVVQCYAEVKPADKEIVVAKRVLVAFAKTKELAPREAEELTLTWADRELARFDDTSHARVLDAGRYTFYVGENIRQTKKCGGFSLGKGHALDLAPQEPFTEPAEITPIAKDGKGYADLKAGRITVEELIARMSREELEQTVRAEGMDSDKGTPGNAAVFGGHTEGLKALGIPVISCIDGPTGLRMEGKRKDYEYPKTVAYPTAVACASTWNEAAGQAAFAECGQELKAHQIDMLLAPGMNIHRYPLCGRNFEYYSEDPLLAGKMAAAACRGLGEAGVSGVVKHFLTNNHEFNRQGTGSRVSERALREIYARCFEIAICESPVRGVMTCYNRINNHWGSCNRPWIKGFLREELGFDGVVMTDWWAYADRADGRIQWQTPKQVDGYRPAKAKLIAQGKETTPLGYRGDQQNLRDIVHAGGDLYMVVKDAVTYKDNLAEAPLAELQEAARHVLMLALYLNK